MSGSSYLSYSIYVFLICYNIFSMFTDKNLVKLEQNVYLFLHPQFQKLLH
jgi:hypothetical protein